jgi:CheY-like chemotaxis protein
MKILVVEDHPAVATITCSLLREAHDHDVTHAATGAAALDQFENFQPELVLIDLNLPDMNGYQLATEIRRRPGGRSIVLVALTGLGSEISERLAEEAGINAFFRKPMDFNLLTTIERKPH